MSREHTKWRKHMEEKGKRELRKANKHMTAWRASQPKPVREHIDASRFDEEQETPLPEEPARIRRKERTPESQALREGWVVETGPGYCDVLASRDRLRCRTQVEAAIGDHVLFSIERQRIESVLQRRTTLSRTDPHNPNRERVIAANVDIVVNVVSLKTPPLRPGLIDRYLIAIGKSGAAPLVCVNKVDLLEDAADIEPLRPFEDIGIPVIYCSAATGSGIAELAGALSGRVCVFTGHSGVGKSSLMNALDPHLGARIGALSEGNDKGRQTTTSSSLYELDNGAIVIDTPGIREFGLWDVSREDLRRYYAEFSECGCAFTDCSHTHEPECGVKAAFESGQIAAARYQGYLRILASLM